MGVVLLSLAKIANIVLTAGIVADAIYSFFKPDSTEAKIADDHVKNAVSAGVDPDEMAKIAAGTKYEQVELAGKSPDDFWAGLTPEQQAALKFSPESLRRSMDRTSFLGLASAVLFAAGAAIGLYGATKGMPIIYKTIAKLAAARSRNESASSLLAIIEEGKIEGLAKVWVPGIVASLAAAGGWLSSSMANNMNDVDFWGRTQLAQAEADFNQLKAREGGGTKSSYVRQPVTRVNRVQNARPKLFQGIVFSGRVADRKELVRKLDDEITDDADLEADIVTNMTNWLATLPGKLNYDVIVVNNPKDDQGMTKTGSWMALNIYLTNEMHKRFYIEQMLLGPIDPVIYYPDFSFTQQLQFEIPGLLKPEQLKALEFPGGNSFGVDEKGNVVPIFGEGAGGAAPTAPAVQEAVPSAPAVVTPSVAKATSTALAAASAAIQEAIKATGAQPPAAPPAPSPAPQQAGSFSPRNDGAQIYTSAMTGKTLAIFENIPDRRQGVLNSLPDFLSSGYFAQIDVDTIKARLGVSTPTASSIAIPPSNNPNKKNATSVAEYFDVNKVNYPTVSVRGKLYEAFGLGDDATYVGSATQNDALLRELKARA